VIQVVSQANIGFSLEEFRDHCRVSDKEHDPALRRSLNAATVDIENKAGVLLRSTTLYDYFRGAPAPFRFAVGPVNAVSALYNVDQAATIDATAYELDFTGAWPMLRTKTSGAFNNVDTYRVTYTAGYSSIPAPLKVAVFELAAMHFENREAATPVQMYALPHSINSILQGYGPRGL